MSQDPFDIERVIREATIDEKISLLAGTSSMNDVTLN